MSWEAKEGQSFGQSVNIVLLCGLTGQGQPPEQIKFGPSLGLV